MKIWHLYKIKYVSVFLVFISFCFVVYTITLQKRLSSSSNSDTELDLFGNGNNKPLLQLKSGLTSTFSQMDLDVKLGFLAAGMQNNQVLLWSLKHHAAPRVFSTPVLGKQSKRSHPVALDPQGRWLAYGVPDSTNGGTDSSKIFLFDLASGKVKKVLRKLESRTQSLRFSPDGNHLAATLSSGYGLRVWSTDNWALIQQVDPRKQVTDAERDKLNINQANHPGLAFNPNQSGRVGVVMVGDSGIWCFGKAPDFKATACLEQSSDTWIAADEAYNSIAFSPDGHRIALATRRSSKILILSLVSKANPQILVAPQRKHKYEKYQYLSEVAWSLNGRYIYAGGMFWLGEPDKGDLQSGIVRWDLRSNNLSKTYPAGTNTVMDIVALGSEGIIYATQDPVIDALELNSDVKINNHLFPIISGNFDMRHWKQKHIVASKNGQIIAFKPYREKKYIKIDLVNRNVSYIEQIDFETTPVYQKASIVSLKNIKNVPATPADKRKPSLNGNTLVMEGSEISRDYAFLPSGKEFIWLSSNAIRFVQANGKIKWSKSLKQDALRVILADEGRLTIVTLGDGTIRWYFTQTGMHLLTLFVARPIKLNEKVNWKWIAWTPEGFYSSSVAGEQLIGWLINDPSDQNNPIYYDFGTFRVQFYRPDIIEQILNVYDIQQAFKIANKNAGLDKNEKIEDMLTTLINNAPPSIDVLSPLNSEVLHPGLTDVCFKLRSPGKSLNKAKEVNIFLDGGLNKSLTGNLEFNKKICHKISLPDSTLKKGALSIKLSVEGTSKATRGIQKVARAQRYESTLIKEKPPRLLGLFVGISDYEQQNLKLDYAEKDAIDMLRFWENQQGYRYDKVLINRIPGADATRNNILAGLERLQNEAKADDFIILFFAGHGATLSGNNRYLFFTRTADTSNIEKLLANSVTDLDLNNALKNMKAKFKVVILDTCRNIFNSSNRRLQRVDSTALRKEVIDFWNAHAFFSAGEGGYAQEENGNGIYTAVMLEGLKGDADLSPFKDQTISISEIDFYTFHKVKNITDGSQLPILVTPDNLEAFKHNPPLVVLNKFKIDSINSR